MNELNQRIIDAIIKKAEAVCSNSLALIGIYGSFATGDTHDKSDLDLLILINDERGQQLTDAFILNDTEIGYDIYCTSWKMLESDARCDHAHLSKLFDAPLVYINDQSAVKRLEELKKKASELLASNERYKKAQAAFDNAQKIYAECFLTDSVSRIRTNAGVVFDFLFDAVMLYHGRYFRKGVKRTFEELGALNLPFQIEEKVIDIIRSETVDGIRDGLTELMRTIKTYLLFHKEKAAPNCDNIYGTYEEMFSNWRNKMQEAAESSNVFSSFMNMASLQSMIHEVAEDVAINDFEIMDSFDPNNLEKNSGAFDNALSRYLEEYHKAGIQPKCFATVNEFFNNYCKME